MPNELQPRLPVRLSSTRGRDGDRKGESLGGYIIGDAIAVGSMGRVYQARRLEDDAPVALKVLHSASVQDPVAVERFRREFETATSLHHQHIVEVHEFGETPDGSYFMAMERLEGAELSVALQDRGAFEPWRALRVLCQLALGLHHAHRHGVIHRDLKPDNVFLCSADAGDQVRILDFGSVKLQVESGAKLTAVGTTIGSPYYMSPEQAMGKLDVDARSDVFALSAILHELATGHIAFAGENAAEILMKIIGENPAPVSASNPKYPWAFDDVIRRGLAKDKGDRYGSTLELAEAALVAFGLDPDVDRYARAQAMELEATLPERSQAVEDHSGSSVAQTSLPPALPLRSNRSIVFFVCAAIGAAVAASVWMLV